MKLPGSGGPVDRDWFGLADFVPGPRFTRDGGLLYLLDEVGSTNTFLRGQGEPARGRLCRWDGWGWVADEHALLSPPAAPAPGTVVVARRQSAGRGRQGRAWRDCGGLQMSVVVPPLRVVHARGFSVWLGLIAALVLREDFHLDVRLKWPNDLMIEDRKLGGILLERAGRRPDSLVVAGLGLNVDSPRGSFPADLQHSATSILVEGGRAPKRGDIAARVVRRVEGELELFQAKGWPPFRPALDLLDCLLGKKVTLLVRSRETTGRAVGIDDAGRLLVLRPKNDGTLESLAFHAGDVHIVPDADRTAETAGGG